MLFNMLLTALAFSVPWLSHGDAQHFKSSRKYWDWRTEGVMTLELAAKVEGQFPRPDS